MARIRVATAVAAVAALVVAGPADAGARARLRVIEPGGIALGSTNPRVGAARAYLDAAGTPHALPADTALGQLVSATGWWGVGLGVPFNDQFGGFVQSIAGRQAGASGFWAFYVDGRAAAAGAETTTIADGQEVVWILDQDFNAPGPFFLDLDVVARRGRSITFRVTRAGGEQPEPAVGASIRVNRRVYRTGAKGTVRVTVPRQSWLARATLAGSAPSELVGQL